MRRYRLIFALAVCVAFGATAATAQRTRTVAQSPAASATPTPQPAPASVTAKYEGGYTTYSKKQTGTLNFDDAGQRLLFKDKYQREYFSLPYAALAAIWSDTRAVTSTTARVMQNVPIIGVGLASLAMPKTKKRYLVLQFDDPDSKVSGTTSFKLENKEAVASVLNTLAQKAAMKPRGEGFIRSTAATDKP